jgi:hypothetical protein
MASAGDKPERPEKPGKGDKPDKPDRPEWCKCGKGEKDCQCPRPPRPEGNRVPDFFGFPELYKQAVEKGLVKPPFPEPLRLVRPPLTEEQWNEIKELEENLRANKENGFFSILTKEQIELREQVIAKLEEMRAKLHERIEKILAKIENEERRVAAYARMLLEEKERRMQLEGEFALEMKKLHEEYRKKLRGEDTDSEVLKKAMELLHQRIDQLRVKYFPEDIMAHLGLTLEQKAQLKELEQQMREERDQALQQILTEEQWQSLMRIRKYLRWLRWKRMEFNIRMAERIAKGEEEAEDVPEGEGNEEGEGPGCPMPPKPERPGKPGRPGCPGGPEKPPIPNPPQPPAPGNPVPPPPQPPMPGGGHPGCGGGK